MSNIGDILFYVLVPVYKVENYISDCINSVLNQDYANYRIIIVDDGSPDKAGDICDEFARIDKRIHVIHQKNMGLIAARDTAIFYIQNECPLDNAYVLFLDSDDSLKPGALRRLDTVLKEHKCDMAIYGMDRVADGKIVIPYDSNESKSEMVSEKRNLYRKVLFQSDYNAVWRKAIRAELVPKKSYKQYYKLSLAEDLLRSLDFYKTAEKVYILNESLYNYTINLDSMTRNISANNFKIDFTIRKLTADFLQSESVFNENDWAEYTGHCIHIINGNIDTIFGFQIPFEQKKDFLEQIYTSQYYKEYIKGKPYKCSFTDLIKYRLFTLRAFHILSILETMRK